MLVSFFASSKMTTLYPKITDWLDCEWGGLYEEEEEESQIYGEYSISLSCYEMKDWIFLPIYGPVNRDEVPMGFLWVTPSP